MVSKINEGPASRLNDYPSPSDIRIKEGESTFRYTLH